MQALTRVVSALAQVLVVQEEELVGARWMPLAEFGTSEFYTARPLFHQIVATCTAWADGRLVGHGSGADM